MLRIRVALAILLFAGLTLVVGCSKTTPRGIVKGRVTIGTKPVTGATVLFENTETGVAVNAPLDPDGRYEVKTYQGDGLPIGSYKVAVVPGGVMTPEEADLSAKATDAKAARAKQPKTPVHERYHKTTTSKFSVEVKEGDNPPFDFQLEP